MFLGLDLGTSGLRGLLVGCDGAPLADASCEYDVSNPHDGWSEQNPDDWINACKKVVADLKQKAPESCENIIGIGISGHMHGAVTLDDKGEVIRPCILWNDVRSAEQAAVLDLDEQFRALSGNIVFPGFTAPKLKWMADNEPDLFARVAKVILPKDYLVYWLTGKYASEKSDASGTSWLEVATRKWSNDLIHATGLNPDHMPELFEGTDVVGTLQQNVASALGLSLDIKVVAGGADNACAACGIGTMEEGEGFVSLGTSGVVLLAKNECVPDASTAVHTFCHAIPDTWYQMGVILSATDSLNWLAGNIGAKPEELSDDLPSISEGPGHVLFLPYLSGERTPHNDADIRASFIGLSKTSDRKVLTQAVMEGVAFALRDCLEALRGTGSNPSSLIAVGGGSKSKFWLSTLANTLGVKILVPGQGEFGAAMGASRLAMLGAGNMASSDVLTQPEIIQTFEPNRELTRQYDDAFQQYQTLYKALKELS